MATKAEKQKEMFDLIEAWKSSGQSQQEFCKEKGLAYSGFHYWYKRYRAQHGSIISPAFIPITISSSTPSVPIAELILPSGKRVQFYQTVDMSFLGSLLE